MAEIITMGELLVDFVPLNKGLPLKENEGFLKAPGGAPANVAVGASKLGAKSIFLGKVGADPFGDFLVEALEEQGVETKYIARSSDAKTALAFVILDKTGDRDFIFYREPSADMLYRWEEIPKDEFKKARIFHYGSISLINEPVRETTLQSAQLARKNNVIVSYDPNLRLPLWPDRNSAKKWIKEGLKFADIVKVSEEELEFITGEKDLEQGAKYLQSFGVKLVFVTLGPDGCYFYYQDKGEKVAGFNVEVMDTTGAGDGFTAAILYQLVQNKIKAIDDIRVDKLKDMVSFANAVGAITTTSKGAITALPDLKSVINFLKLNE